MQSTSHDYRPSHLTPTLRFSSMNQCSSQIYYPLLQANETHIFTTHIFTMLLLHKQMHHPDLLPPAFCVLFSLFSNNAIFHEHLFPSTHVSMNTCFPEHVFPSTHALIDLLLTATDNLISHIHNACATQRNLVI